VALCYTYKLTDNSISAQTLKETILFGDFKLHINIMWEMLKAHNSFTKRLYKQKWFIKCNKIKKFKDTKLSVVNSI